MLTTISIQKFLVIFMNHKSIIALFLSATLLSTSQLCFAMEKEQDEESKHIMVGFDDANEFITTLSKTVHTMHDKALAMKYSIEKAEAFGQIVKFLELNMPGIREINDPLTTELLTLFLAFNLRYQGATLHNCALIDEKATPESRIQLSKNAVDLLRKSCKIYNELGNKPQIKEEAAIASGDLADILGQLGAFLSVYASKTKSVNEIIKLHTIALANGKEAYEIKKTSDLETALKTQLKLALFQGFAAFCTIISDIKIFKDSDTQTKYNTLIMYSNVLNNNIKLFNDYLINPPVKINWRAINDTKTQKKSPKTKVRNALAIPDSAFEGLPKVYSPEEYVIYMWSTYCGVLKGASNTVANLVGVNDQISALYKAKEAEHLEQAIQAYHDHIYQGEYKNHPTKETEYILASLESLAENEKPLRDFYSKLRKERRDHDISQVIREGKEKREREETAKKKIYEEQRKAIEERANKQRALHATTTSESTSPHELPSFDEKEIEPCIQEKMKKKTRGEAHTPLLQIIEKEKAPLTVEPKIITLNSENYSVFQCLTGEKYDRNITLEKVLTLLKTGFSCKITNATGGGSHRKATAPNNYVWTIPPEWKGKIPAPYRNELMNFLLVNMGIIDGLLEVREGK